MFAFQHPPPPPESANLMYYRVPIAEGFPTWQEGRSGITSVVSIFVTQRSDASKLVTEGVQHRRISEQSRIAMGIFQSRYPA